MENVITIGDMVIITQVTVIVVLMFTISHYILF